MAHFKRTSAAIVASVLTGSLVFSMTPVAARAASSTELQQQLGAAQDRLYALYAAAEQAGNNYATVNNDLNATIEAIEKTSAEIAEEERQLAEFQDELTGMAVAQYKMGGRSNFISLLVGSNSLSSLMTSLHYADKAAEHKQSVITTTRELRESLEQKRSSLEEDKEKQEKLVADQAKKLAAAQAAADEAQGYYDQLSDDLKQAIAAEEEAARQEAEAEADRVQAQGGSNAGTSSGGNAPNTGNSGGGGNSTGAGSNSGNVSGTPTGSASAMVARAQGVIGSGYSYTGYKWTGDPRISYFTCSGLVDYAMGLAPWSNSPASYMNKVKARGAWTSNVDQLKYGDLVFFTTNTYCGHVGIYVGGGRMIDSIPGAGVGYRSLSYIGGFIGGGAII